MTASEDNLWSAVVASTERLGDPILRSARIPVFLTLRDGPYRDGQSIFRSLRGFARMCLGPVQTKKTLIDTADVLFAMVYATPSTVGNLQPVIDQVRGADVSSAVLGPRVLLESGGRCHKAIENVTTESMFAWVSRAKKFRALAFGSREARRLRSEISKEGGDEMSERLKGKLGVLAVDIANAYVAYAAAYQLIDAIRPKVVIGTSDFWPLEHNLMAAANGIGAETIVVQHGLTSSWWFPFVAKKLAVWGEVFADEMHARGCSRDRLLKTGMPATDSIFRRRTNEAPKTQTPLRTILLIGNTHSRQRVPEIYERYAALLRAVVAQTPNVEWLVKLHPRETEDYFRSIGLTSNSNFRVLDKSISLETALSMVDATCVMYSTAGLEAMASGLPVLVPEIGADVVEYTWWPKFGGGVFVRDSASFLEVISRLDSDASWRDELMNQQSTFLKRAFANQGNAAAAVWQLVREKLNPVYE